MSRPHPPLKFLFVADPLENFDYRRETSLYLMREAARRGHEIHVCVPQELSSVGKNPSARCRKLRILGPGRKDWYRVIAESKKLLKTFDVVLPRKDPPFDLSYLHHIYLLNLVSDEVYMMNHPRGILIANEKLAGFKTAAKSPQTLLSASQIELKNFVRRNPAGVILKPLDSSGGRGIFLIRGEKSPNLQVILETCTQNFTRHIIAQVFIPEIKKGDKRIMLLGGEILGCFTRKPARGEHRANLHAGGSLHPSRITDQDRRIVASLNPFLKKYGLDFVGIDIIGNYLTEINLTSPMGLREINATSGGRSERKVIDFIENRVMNFGRKPSP